MINWSDVKVKVKYFSSLDVSFITSGIAREALQWKFKFFSEEYVAVVVKLISLFHRWGLLNILPIVIKFYFANNLWNLCLSPTTVPVFFDTNCKYSTSVNS